ALLSQFSDLQANAAQRLNNLFDPTLSARNRTSGRFELAQAAWPLFLAHPLGIGTGGFEVEAPQLSSYGLERTLDAHSAWAKTLSENGALGALLLAAFVLS